MTGPATLSTRDGAGARRVLFYDDVTVFGGHEKMALSLLEQLFRFTGYSAVFVFAKKNRRLAQELKLLQEKYPDRLSLVPTRYASGRMPTLEMFWQLPQLVALVRLFKSLAPAFAIIVQGNVELSIKGLVAARVAGIPAVSYLPYVGPFSDIPDLPLAGLRDLCNKLLYKLPQGHVVIADAHRKTLIEDQCLCSTRLFVLRNLVDGDQLTEYPKTDAREKLGLPPSGVIITVLGRLHFKGKGQDVAVRALSGLLGKDLRLLVVGEGPDREQLMQLAAPHVSDGSVVLIDWVENPSVVYSATDIILMPSNLEGVPLVLLEALLFGKMVLASDIPPFDEYLPSDRRFQAGDEESLRQCVLRALSDLQGGAYTPRLVTMDSDMNREEVLRLVHSMTVDGKGARDA
ncbi:glycosyltransferase [Geobacter sp. DSM 9736]|uniref:glycosyltransferase n=1 Tax=Geobacter sp. DSM 9736 TaxID=1277350 RepID=UPI000B50C802|nr:glycosyltransferase [Geobacter sp. DSM 9736]SNB46612.1 Glycosyltransferase involved in cell wall bisynthesis [Geobacter sp. DSM 9736]